MKEMGSGLWWHLLGLSEIQYGGATLYWKWLFGPIGSESISELCQIISLRSCKLAFQNFLVEGLRSALSDSMGDVLCFWNMFTHHLNCNFFIAYPHLLVNALLDIDVASHAVRLSSLMRLDCVKTAEHRRIVEIHLLPLIANILVNCEWAYGVSLNNLS